MPLIVAAWPPCVPAPRVATWGLPSPRTRARSRPGRRPAPSAAPPAWRTPPASRCAGSRCAGSTVPGAAARAPAAAGAARQRPAPDARARAASGAGSRSLADARARPGRQHRRQPRPPATRCPPCSTRFGDAARRARACSSSAPTTTSRRRCATRCATCCPTTASATPTPRSCPGGDLRDGFERRGWVDLTNRRDDARRSRARRSRSPASTTRTWSYDDLAAVAGPADPDGRRAHRRRARAVPPGARPVRRATATTSILAGHTHGGQLCLPGQGRPGHQLRPRHRRAPRGCTGTRPTRRPGDPGPSWLHVSAGAGTSPYAPVRFCCRPEATLLTLTRPIPVSWAPATRRLDSPTPSGCGAAW